MVTIIENAPTNLNFHSGQKITHSILGKGVVVGFSNITGEPFIFFYDKQQQYADRVVCINHKEIICV